jgi:eukaryotic-like serine/threonine-protein kinase
MIGQTISHYKILSKLGEGGMGVVYKAEDRKLHRFVALKFLPPELTRDQEAKERFVQEAQAASALDHPNICNIHEIDETEDGQMFICMAQYDGESLKSKIARGPLDLDEAVDIAAQVSQGLARAHERGIVHRDVKPANVMVTGEGVVKILDFGVAKLGGHTRLTKTGTTVGTAAYMSPEQARGEDVDHRADIWSLGVLLYEMVAGRLPFGGEHEQAVLYMILNQDPSPLAALRPDVPEGLQRVVDKTLEKDRANRYQDIRAVIDDLRSLSASGSALPEGKKSIVVLPFEDISPGRDNEYFSDGLTEEIITDLSKIDAMRVISRNSAMVLKGTGKSTKTIGRELNVQYVLEGSVRKAGNSLRITAQLIDATKDVHLWAEKYHGTLDDVFDIQEKVSRAIVDSLRLKLSPEQDRKVAERPIPNVHAYECYLRAKREVYLFTEEGLERALRYLQKGLEIVGENALLYAGMGLVYWQYVNIGIKQEDYTEKAEACAKKAFELDPESAEGHVLQGLIVSCLRSGPKQAVRHFKMALAVSPNDPDALAWLISMYAINGKSFAAVPLMNTLLEIAPLNSFTYIKQALVYFYDGRFDVASESALKSRQLDPESAASIMFSSLLLASQGRVKDAIAFVDDNVDGTSTNFWSRSCVFLKHALLGNGDIADVVTSDFKATARRDFQYSAVVADCYALLGSKDESLDWLENAVNHGFVNYPFLSQHDSMLENIRGEERFKKLMERVKYEWEHFEV